MHLPTYLRLLLFVAMAILTITSDSQESSSRSSMQQEQQSRVNELRAKKTVMCDDRAQGFLEAYTTFHRAELQKERPRLLVAVPHPSGFSDRVTGFVTMCLLAMLTNRAFQIGKLDGLHDIETAFTSPYINWSRTAGLDPHWLVDPLLENAETRQYNDSVLDKKEYFAVNTINNIGLQDMLIDKNLTEVLGGSSSTVMMSMNRGKTVRLSENPTHGQELLSHGLDPYNTFGCLTNYLLKPRREILDLVPAIVEKMTYTDSNNNILKISIQIRDGDQVFRGLHSEVNLNEFRTYFACAEQIEAFAVGSGEFTGGVIWYLTSDNLALRRAAVEYYGADKVLTDLSHTPMHSADLMLKGEEESRKRKAASIEGFKLAAAEWWLMGFAHYHVITKTSGFGRTAGFRSLRRDSIYTVHANSRDSDTYAHCGPENPTDIEHLFYDWSGI